MDDSGSDSRDEPASRRVRHKLVKRSVVEHVKPVVIGGVDEHGFSVG